LKPSTLYELLHLHLISLQMTCVLVILQFQKTKTLVPKMWQHYGELERSEGDERSPSMLVAHDNIQIHPY
jgi:hypothetical protein